jgi:hypothetical protein
MRIRALIAAIAVCLSVPTSAAGSVGVVDMPQRATDTGRHTIILEAPDDAWGMRIVADDLTRRIPGLSIRTERGITCDDKVSCIRVHIGKFDHACGSLGTRWYGCASIGTDPGVIWLDTSTSTFSRRNEACHELGHALGLHHHTHRGCVGEGFLELASDYEVNALSAVFR